MVSLSNHLRPAQDESSERLIMVSLSNHLRHAQDDHRGQLIMVSLSNHLRPAQDESCDLLIMVSAHGEPVVLRQAQDENGEPVEPPSTSSV